MATRILVRNSERSSFTQCRWMWDISYVQRYRPNESGMNALMFGDIVHRALADWYIKETALTKVKRGVHPAITLQKIFLQLIEEEFPGYRSESFEEHMQLGIDMMNAYVENYGQDEQYMVVHPEMPFQYDVYNDRGQYVCTLVGTTDVLVRERSSKKMGMLEHKTAAQINTSHLIMDPQANTYWTIVPMWLRENGILKPDDDITFMDYNFLRKTSLEDKHKNADGTALKPPTIAKLKEALDGAGVDHKGCKKKQDFIDLCEDNDFPWQELGEPYATQHGDLFVRERVTRTRTQREKTMARILAQVREMKMVRAGKLEAYKMPGKHCGWCQYRDVCEADEIGNDTEEILRFAFHRWNPYRDHIWSLKLTG